MRKIKMKKKLKNYPLKKAVKDEFLKIIIRGEFKIYKDELIKKLRGHEKLYRKDYQSTNRSIVGCVNILTDEFLNDNSPTLITPFPIFHRDYDGWQIVTNKTKINELIQQIREEKYRKVCRKLKNAIERYLKEKSVDNKLGSFPDSKIKEIEKTELKSYKTILLSDSRKQ